MQRLRSRTEAGDDGIDGRIDELQSGLTQTQHTVTGLLHVETRIDAISKKVDVLHRSLNRSDDGKLSMRSKTPAAIAAAGG